MSADDNITRMNITGNSSRIRFETNDLTELERLRAFAELVGAWYEYDGENGVIIEIQVSKLLAFEDYQTVIHAAG